MMKKVVFSLFCISGFVTMALAQVTTNDLILKKAAIDYKIAGNQNYAKARSMAKAKGWALTIKTRDGRTGVLVGVDPFGFPKYYINSNNIIAAATTRANQLWPGGETGLNLSGSSANMKNKLGIWDGGAVLGTHVELVGRVTQKDSPSSTDDHATHVSGTMIASGVNPLAKGMAFGAQGMIAYDYTNDIAEMFGEASNIVLSNHSYTIVGGWNYNSDQSRWEYWGLPNSTEDYKFGYYSSDSQSLDSMAYNSPYYLIVKAAGNWRGSTGPDVGQPYYRLNASGTMVSAGNRPAGISSNDSYDGIIWDCGAKNILTVGAVSGIPGGYTRKEDVVMSSFSSWGPTDDGRIKPDVVADGVNVLSSVATTTTSYATYSGTSMASPNTTGSLFLLQEYYSKLKSGAFMRSATLKGLAIHTADEAGFYPGPDYQFGWGLLNVEKAAAVITAAVPSNNATTSNHLMYENTLNNGQTYTTNVVASGNGAIRATICWTDVKGNVDNVNILNNRTKKLVNDLDIRITKGSGTTLKTYYPWTLDVNNPATGAVPGDNITDNVERIDIDSTVPGQVYTITVTNKGTLARGSQAYSLLVSGVGGASYCASTSGGGGARIDSVSFKNLHVVNSAGSKTYTDNTSYIATIEPSQTVPIAIKLSTNGSTSNNRIVKVFIDLNNNGTFESSELLATSGVLTSASQLYTTNISIPGSVTVGNICLMRIIVQETSNASDIQACGTYGQGETQDYSVKVVPASNDVLINQILSPAGGDCANNGSAFLTVSIKNNGSADQSRVPVAATITGGGTTLNFSAVYPGTVSALTTVNYTFQTPFTTTAGTTYTISATTNLAADQIVSNNQAVATIAIAAKGTSPAGAGELCGTSAILKVSNAVATNNYFWYSSTTTTTPFAPGVSATTTTIPPDKTYYLGKEAKVSVGPVNKLVYASGGYNSFYNNFVKFNNAVPVTIENARLYIGNPGKITFTLADLISDDVTTGSYSYQPISAVTLDVYATNPNPTPGAVSGNLAADSGAVYYLNLPVPTTGDHIIIIQCQSGNDRADSASIFRNNQITGTTYPLGIPGIMTFTGNSANTGGSLESQYYYFFYDVHINTGACVSDRVAVTAVPAPVPVISQQADSLLSSISTGNQWYLNDSIIAGATNNHYKPTKSGKYKVIVTDSFACAQVSNVITYVVTAIANVQAEEIKLKVSPNPNKGIFNLSFEVTTKADLTIDILNSAGRKVYTSSTPDFIGTYSKQITIDDVSSELYVIKIQHDKKVYVSKLLIQR
jgi:hypothetical protein